MTIATYALHVDGRHLPPVRAVVERGHVLVPVRVLADALTADVTYDPATKTVIVRRAARTQRLAVGRIVRGHAYAPLRAVADALGVDVTYDAPQRRIALTGVTRVASELERTPTAPTPAPVAVAPTAPVLIRILSPASGSSIDNAYPSITAQLLAPGATVVPGSVQMTLDGVTLDASLVGDVVTATPRSSIGPGTHTVIVTGSDRSGEPFRASWSFAETANVSQRWLPALPALEQVYLDHVPQPGDRTFDVIAYGAPGANGYVTVDGVPGSFALFPTTNNQYVSHVLLPLGVNQRSARVYVHMNPLAAPAFTYVLPTVFSLSTVPPSAQPAATPSMINGGPRHALHAPATPSPAPAATPTPRPVRRQVPPRAKASASPSASVPS